MGASGDVREFVSGVDKKQLAVVLRGANEELRAGQIQGVRVRSRC